MTKKLDYCLMCGCVEMTDTGCRVCGGGAGREATNEEIAKWEKTKKGLGLVWNGVKYIIPEKSTKNSWQGCVDRMSGAYDDSEIADYYTRRESW